MKKLITLLLLLLPAVIPLRADYYQITYKKHTAESSVSASNYSTYIESGSSYISSGTFNYCYTSNSAADFRVGKSSAAGKATYTLSNAGKVHASTIVVNAKLYNSSKAATLSVNGKTAQDVTADYSDLTFTIDDDITQIIIDTSKYVYVHSITVNYSSTPAVAPTIKVDSEAISGTTFDMLTTSTLDITAPTGYTLSVTATPAANAYILVDNDHAVATVSGSCVMTVTCSATDEDDIVTTLNITVPTTTDTILFATDSAYANPVSDSYSLSPFPYFIYVKSVGGYPLSVSADITANAGITIVDDEAEIEVTGPVTLTALSTAAGHLPSDPSTLTLSTPQVAPIKFYSGDNELTGPTANVAPNSSISITTDTTGALISYSTDGGSTWSTPATPATVAVASADVTVTARATLEGYTPAEEVTITLHPSTTVTDVITTAQTLPSKNGYNNKVWTGPTSDAEYFARTYRENASTTFIQVNNNSGWIMTTASGGTLQSIKFIVNTSKQSSTARTITVYGSNRPFEGDADTTTTCPSVDGLLYDSSNTCTVDSSTATATIDVTGDYEYFLIKTSGACYFNQINVTWSTTPDTQCRQPSLAVTGKRDTENAVVALTAADYTVIDATTTYYHVPVVVAAKAAKAGQQIRYNIDYADEWSEAAGSPVEIDIEVNHFIRAKAVADGLDDSEMAEINVILAPPAPTSTTDIGSPGDDEIIPKTVLFSCADPASTIQYRFKKGPASFGEWTDGSSLLLNEIGVYAIEARAVRTGWTDSQVISLSVTIDDPTANKPFTLVRSTGALSEGMEIILVDTESSVAMAPYGGSNYFGKYAVTIDGTGDTRTVTLPASQSNVEVLTLEKNGSDWLLRTTIGEDTADGYVCTSTTSNQLKIETASASPSDYAKTSISIAGNESDYEATIQFAAGATRYLQYNYSISSLRFSTYNNTQRNVRIFARNPQARVERPTVSIDEGFHTADQLASGVSISCATDNATIYYTLDGSNPYTSDTRLTYNGTPVDVSGGALLQIVAEKDGMRPSHIVICNYHVFTGDKVYTRVTTPELQNLRPGDELIIVASPTGSDEYFALGRVQKESTAEGVTTAYREAVELSSASLAAISQGRITVTQPLVQPVSLIAGDDDYEGFDWRLYTSGTLDNSSTGASLDGYLYSAGENNTLQTNRITNPDAEILANADVRFLSFSRDGIGNEYGGVTFQFGSPDGNEETYPNHIGLRYLDGSWRFNSYTIDQIEGNVNGYSDIYHVSVFKAYPTDLTAAPTFSTTDRLNHGDPLALSCVTTGATIYYSVDIPLTPGDDGWTPYSGPIYLETGSHTIYAYAAHPSTGASEVASHTFLVTAMQAFELVKAGDEIHESDRLLIVNAIPYPDPDDIDPVTGEKREKYFAMSTVINTGGNKYLYAQEVEYVPAVGTEGSEGYERPKVLLGENPTYNPAILNVVLDPSGTYPKRPYLIRVEGLTDSEHDPQYFKSTAAKVINFVSLPDDYAERASMNVRIDIKDTEWDGKYTSDNTTGDFLDYGNTSHGSSDYSAGTGFTEGRYGDLKDKAQIVFNGDATNVIRFNATGKVIHFNAYDTDDPDADNVPFHTSTWPIQLYRATDVVFPPSMTVYPSSVDYTRPGEYTYSTTAAANDVEVFYNPVKIEIKQNPRTASEATLMYSWSYSKTAAPAPEEYTAVGANSFEIFLDGYDMTLDGTASSIEQYYYNGKVIDPANLLSTPTIRAIAQLDADTYSRSLPRTIHFKTTAPIVKHLSYDDVNGTETVSINRPKVYTLGASLRYSLDGGTTWTDIKRDGDEFENVTVANGSTLIVGAFKTGYEPTYTTYAANNYYTEIRPIQLLELTDAGKTALDNTSRKYLTYRTGEFDDEYYYVMDPDSGSGIGIDRVDTDKARALIADPSKFLWTPDFYVMALNYTDMLDALSSTPSDLTVTVTDGTYAPITATPSEFAFDSENNRTYYGCIIDRDGIIGQRSMEVDLNYSIGSTPYATNSITNVAPLMPKAYTGYYRYQAHQYSAEEGHPEQDLDSTYGTEYLKFRVKSSVKYILDPETYEPVYDDCEVLIPTADLDPRRLDCVIAFDRPNISNEVLSHYDIFYTLGFSNNLGETLPGSGVYSDREEDSNASDGRYAFAISRVHPSSTVYPVMEVITTEYVQNQNADDSYGSYTANYGSTLSIPARNHTVPGESSIGKIYLGKAAGDTEYTFNGYTHTPGKVEWMYRGHDELTHGGDVIVDPSASALDHTNDDPSLTLSPVFFHVETYVKQGDFINDYASYEYLVKHIEGHQTADRELGTLGYTNDADPLIGTVIASGFSSAAEPHVVLTPVYIFWHDTNTEEGGDDLTPASTTTLEIVRPTTAASEVAPLRAKAPALTSAGSVTPDSSVTQPMIHQGTTDMAAANITDLTDSSDFVAIKTAPLDINTGGDQGGLTGVEQISIDAAAEASPVYYNLQGIRVVNPQPGHVYIVRRGSSTTKELIR